MIAILYCLGNNNDKEKYIHSQCSCSSNIFQPWLNLQKQRWVMEGCMGTHMSHVIHMSTHSCTHSLRPQILRATLLSGFCVSGGKEGPPIILCPPCPSGPIGPETWVPGTKLVLSFYEVLGMNK